MLFTGRLTADAKANTVKGDKQVINFTVALNERWKSKTGENMEKTAYVDCAYWRNTAIGEYLTKGAVVEISGWVEAQAYQSTKEGLRARLVCTCDTIKLFSSFPKSEEKAVKTERTTAPAGKGGEDDDLPF